MILRTGLGMLFTLILFSLSVLAAPTSTAQVTTSITTSSSTSSPSTILTSRAAKELVPAIATSTAPQTSSTTTIDAVVTATIVVPAGQPIPTKWSTHSGMYKSTGGLTSAGGAVVALSLLWILTLIAFAVYYLYERNVNKPNREQTFRVQQAEAVATAIATMEQPRRLSHPQPRDEKKGVWRVQ